MPKIGKDYGNELYKPENIVAYTGDIDKNPSVYFQINHDNGDITYGHITQDHKNKFNIGKEEVRTSDSYEFKNEMVYNEETKLNELRSFEYDQNVKQGTHFHRSRNPHIKVDPNDLETIVKLAESIGSCKDIKPKYLDQYVQDKIKEYKDTPDFEKKLDELSTTIEQVTKKYVKKKPGNKLKYEAREKRCKDLIDIEKTALQKDKIEKEKVNEKPNLKELSKPVNLSSQLSDSQKSQLQSAQSKNDPKQSKDNKKTVQL